MPSVVKFDGTPLAGGLHRVGPCGKKILIGASVHIDLATALQWCHNNAELEQRVKSVTNKLYRSVDAFHVQSLIIPLSTHFADYYFTAASHVPELIVGQKVEARAGRGAAQRYTAATATFPPYLLRWTSSFARR